jgi:hypothetical protein
LRKTPLSRQLSTQHASANFPQKKRYHTAAVRLVQWLDPLYPQSPSSAAWVVQLSALFAMGYITAVVEAVSISAFPHYRYPDRPAMLTVGSAFYSLLFVVTYPMYVELHRAHARHCAAVVGEGGGRRASASMSDGNDCAWTLWRVLCHALAASMMVLLNYELWRLTVGRISPLVDPTTCPPYTHPLLGRIDAPEVSS